MLLHEVISEVRFAIFFLQTYFFGYFEPTFGESERVFFLVLFSSTSICSQNWPAPRLASLTRFFFATPDGCACLHRALVLMFFPSCLWQPNQDLSVPPALLLLFPSMLHQQHQDPLSPAALLPIFSLRSCAQHLIVLDAGFLCSLHGHHHFAICHLCVCSSLWRLPSSSPVLLQRGCPSHVSIQLQLWFELLLQPLSLLQPP